LQGEQTAAATRPALLELSVNSGVVLSLACSVGAGPPGREDAGNLTARLAGASA